MSNHALIILDMQLGNFVDPHYPIFKGEVLISQIKSLLIKIRATQIPVIYVQHNGGKGDPDEPGTSGWEIHPSITPRKRDLIVQKSTPDAFHNTSLKSELGSREIKKIIIAGLQTEYCIDTTCRRAFSLNYEVTLVEDAHSTWNSDLLTAEQIINHHNAVLGDWFVTLKTTSDVLRQFEV